MIKVYIDVRTEASLQGSSDVKARVRDTLGISNAQLPVAQIETLDKEVRDDCDAVPAGSSTHGSGTNPPDSLMARQLTTGR